MFKRKRDGIYYTSIKQDGKRIFKSLETRDEAIARSRESEILKQDQIFTLSFIADEWIDSIKNKSKRYQADSRQFLNQFINWSGDKLAETIAHIDLVNYKYYLKTKTENKKAYKNNSVGFHFRTIKAMFSYSVRCDYLIKSPFRNSKSIELNHGRNF